MRESSGDILFIDPGKLNGVALYSLDDDVMSLCELSGPACIGMVDSLIHFDGPPLVVGVEAFIITSETAKRSQDGKASIEMIGMIRRAVSEEYNNFNSFKKPYEFNDRQTSSVVKTFCPDRILKELGWWNSKLEGHAHDAARHVMYYLAQKRWLNEKQKDALLPREE